MQKIKLIISILVAFLLFGFIGSNSVIADLQDPGERDQIGTNQTNPFGIPDLTVLDQNIFLPLILNNYCKSPYASPFSVQIAGLSDLTNTTLSTKLTRVEIDQLKEKQIKELDEIFSTLVTYLADSGAGWARVYIDWAQIESTKGNRNWTWYDEKLSLVSSTGVKMIATIANPPAWAAVNPDGGDIESADPCSNVISDNNDYYNFISELVGRYKTAPYNIHVWEILNEPDAMPGYRCGGGLVTYGLNGTGYGVLAQGTAQLIKSLDPSAKIIMGGLAYDWFYNEAPDGKFNRYFIDDFAAEGNGVNSIDAWNFHFFKDFALEWERWTIGNLPTCGPVSDGIGPTYFTYGTGVIAKGSHLINRMKTCYGINKPLWISEVGHHGTQDNVPIGQNPENYDLNNQARYVFKVYAQALSLGTENVTWYALKIVRSVTTNDYQGLLDDNNNPKPAYYAYQTLTNELDGYGFVRTINIGSGNEAYEFTNPCEGTKIIAWYNTVDENANSNMTISGKTNIQLVYRPGPEGGVVNQSITDGGSGDLDGLINNSISIRLTLEPVIINLNPQN
ncbi:MAG: glycoside hydrolase 5 family protein [Anaerolineaceae bacterium]